MLTRVQFAAAAYLAFTVLVISGCTSPPGEATAEEMAAKGDVTAEEMTRAGDALMPLKMKLMGALIGALKEGGAEHAISACKHEAPEITAAAGAEGVEIGRTSHKLRNPDNAPEPWMKPFLEEYLANTEDSEPRATRLPDGRVGYVEPIRMKGLCLTCHGESIDEKVQTKLGELYPEDQATGFRMGDLRGLFWAKLD